VVLRSEEVSTCPKFDDEVCEVDREQGSPGRRDLPGAVRVRGVVVRVRGASDHAPVSGQHAPARSI